MLIEINRKKRNYRVSGEYDDKELLTNAIYTLIVAQIYEKATANKEIIIELRTEGPSFEYSFVVDNYTPDKTNVYLNIPEEAKVHLKEIDQKIRNLLS